MAKARVVFINFLEYWHYAKHFSEKQRTVFFNSMAKDEQERIEKSYVSGGWDDVFKRNIIDKMLDDFKDNYNVDLIDIKYKVLHNKTIYLSKKIWSIMTSELYQYGEDHIEYCLGGIKGVPAGLHAVLLVPHNDE